MADHGLEEAFDQRPFVAREHRDGSEVAFVGRFDPVDLGQVRVQREGHRRRHAPAGFLREAVLHAQHHPFDLGQRRVGAADHLAQPREILPDHRHELRSQAHLAHPVARGQHDGAQGLHPKVGIHLFGQACQHRPRRHDLAHVALEFVLLALRAQQDPLHRALVLALQRPQLVQLFDQVALARAERLPHFVDHA